MGMENKNTVDQANEIIRLRAVICQLLDADNCICENIGSKSDQAMQRIAAIDAANRALSL